MSPENKPMTGRRTVCDHCRRRRIRCDGEFPCNQCGNASLTCKREHVPRRRGPKRGTGRVINELRNHQEGDGSGGGSHHTYSSGPPSIDQGISDSTDPVSLSPTPNQQRWRHPLLSSSSESSHTSHITEEPSNSLLTRDRQFLPNRPSPSYLHLIPTCVELFIEHIYPIMPLIHIPTLRSSIVARPQEMYEKNLIYSLCALTSTHMSGKSIPLILASYPPSWEAAGRFFLDECISVRQSYDFVEDRSLYAVISSYFVSTAFFELNQNKKSWYYLREALTMGQDLRFDDENTYASLSPTDALCMRRTFWILYVTERSFAILRHKPLTLSRRTPSIPDTLHAYEAPEIHSGFTHLVNSYHLLDASFVESWNESTSPATATATYTTLQQQLSNPHPTSNLSLTSIQKADILVTQQWLRLIVWQSSMRQGLLSSTAEDESMTFQYPLKIAHSLLDVISSLPTSSIEVHGMGIFEKIFEIGNTMLDVLQACGNSLNLGLPVETYGVGRDPFEMFIKTLSQTPNSQRQYAALLLAKAREKPEIQRFSMPLGGPFAGHNGLPNMSNTEDFEYGNEETGPLGGSMPGNGIGSSNSMRGWRGSIVGEIGEGLCLMPPFPSREWRGSIVGEIGDDGVYTENEEARDVDEEMSSAWVGSKDVVWSPEINDQVITAENV